MSKTKQQNKKRFILVLLIVLILAIAVGYAAFSDTLTISGTANAKGTFDLEFQNAAIVSGTAQGVKLTGTGDVTSITPSADNDTLTVKVVDIAYPGAGVQFHTDIKNVGTIPAKIKRVNTTGLNNSNRAIKITGLDAITTGHPVIQPNGVCSLDFAVVWDANTDLADATNGDSVTFSLEIEYEQDTTASSAAASHTN